MSPSDFARQVVNAIPAVLVAIGAGCGEEAPAADWFARLTVPSGGSVQAQAWGLASAPASAKLRVVWSRSGVNPGADSSITTASGPGGILLVIPPRRL